MNNFISNLSIVKNSWNNFSLNTNLTIIPMIKYIFYKTGDEITTRGIVSEDSKNIVFYVIKVNSSTANIMSFTCFCTAKSKLNYVDMFTGIVYNTYEDIVNYFNVIQNEIASNNQTFFIYSYKSFDDIFAYYIPNQYIGTHMYPVTNISNSDANKIQDLNLTIIQEKSIMRKYCINVVYLLRDNYDNIFARKTK